MSDFEDFSFKVTVIGDGAVGKTSLIKRYTKGNFERNYIQTIGAQFSRYKKSIDNDNIELIFWDIAGQDDFTFLHPLFYKESKANIIVFSLEKNNLGEESFQHIKAWHNQLKKYCKEIPVVLFANKVDLINEEELDYSSIQAIVDKYGFIGYYLTSAKTGQGVIDAFDAIIDKLYQHYKSLSSE